MNYLSRRGHDFSDLSREMNSLWRDIWAPVIHEERELAQAWAPAADVSELKDHFLVSVEMPGIPRDEIKIEVVENTITVSGERHSETKRTEHGTWYGERRFGKFQRSFRLPEGINADNIEANHQDGVLHLMIPKAASAKPRQIKISSGSSFFGKLLGDSQTANGKDRVA